MATKLPVNLRTKITLAFGENKLESFSKVIVKNVKSCLTADINSLTSKNSRPKQVKRPEILKLFEENKKQKYINEVWNKLITRRNSLKEKSKKRDENSDNYNCNNFTSGKIITDLENTLNSKRINKSFRSTFYKTENCMDKMEKNEAKEENEEGNYDAKEDKNMNFTEIKKRLNHCLKSKKKELTVLPLNNTVSEGNSNTMTTMAFSGVNFNSTKTTNQLETQMISLNSENPTIQDPNSKTVSDFPIKSSFLTLNFPKEKTKKFFNSFKTLGAFNKADGDSNLQQFKSSHNFLKIKNYVESYKKKNWKRFETSHKENSGKNGQIEELLGTINELKSEVDELKKYKILYEEKKDEVDSQMKENEKIMEKNEEMKDEIDILKEEFQINQQKLTESENQVKELANILDKNYNNYEQKILNLKHLLMDKDKEITKLKSKIEEYGEKLKKCS